MVWTCPSWVCYEGKCCLNRLWFRPVALFGVKTVYLWCDSWQETWAHLQSPLLCYQLGDLAESKSPDGRVTSALRGMDRLSALCSFALRALGNSVLWHYSPLLSCYSRFWSSRLALMTARLEIRKKNPKTSSDEDLTQFIQINPRVS